MNESRYLIEALAGHDRSRFDSGVPQLDHYLQTQAGQHQRRRIANCFVAVTEGGEVAGYYTLAAISLPLTDLPREKAGKLPRYPAIPAALLGRLAVALGHRGRGLGALLVADALARAQTSDLAAHYMIVDAKDAAAARFYAHLEFLALPSHPLRLVRAL